MTDTNDLFLRHKANGSRLQAFGFVEVAGGHVYTATLLDGNFSMTVAVSNAGGVTADVIDAVTGEAYVLHRVPGATGAFVGQVREEYECTLARIAESCFEPDVFKSEGARRVIQYVRDTYQNEPEYLWKGFPHNAIVRRADNRKWYLVILTVQKNKLGLPGDGSLEVADIRMRPEDVTSLVDGERYFAGWHMNKKHWVTLCLESPTPDSPPLALPVPLEEIFCRIDDSFALATR